MNWKAFIYDALIAESTRMVVELIATPRTFDTVPADILINQVFDR